MVFEIASNVNPPINVFSIFALWTKNSYSTCSTLIFIS